MHLTTYDLDIFNDITNSKNRTKKKWSIVQIVLIENIAMRMKLFLKIFLVCTRFVCRWLDIAFMVDYCFAKCLCNLINGLNRVKQFMILQTKYP